MSFVPLFDLLGFESSLALAVLVSFAGAHLGARAARRRREGRSPSEIALDEARPVRAVLHLYACTLMMTEALLVAPLLVLLLDALRVRNCDLPGGLAFYALLPGLSAATGAAAGVCAGLLVPRRRWGAALAIAIVLASVAWGLWRFWSAPPVFGFDPFVGWFPGALYDEELRVGSSLLLARAVHLLGVAAALAVAAAFLDGRRFRIGRPRSLASAAIALVLVAGWLVARAAAQPTIAPDARSIAAALGARRDTAHLTLLYSPSGPWAKEIDLVAADAEFRLAGVERALGVGDGPRITCWLFDGPDDKRRLLGAGHTQIAKPWRREIYLQHAPWPHPTIAHELAHAVAGRFGDRWFGVARRGPWFDVGLIEGLAVAVEPRLGRLSLDEEVKAMRLLGLEPPLLRVMGPGFLGAAPARAYTVAGSFVRFLLDGYGPAPLRRVYREGGSDAGWRAAYGRPLEALAADWSRRIDATPLDPRERDRAAEPLKQPSIFHKTCAHELAVRREEARALAARGDTQGAIDRLRSICRDEPDDPSPLVDIVERAGAGGDRATALAAARRLLDQPKSSPGQRARVFLFLGDDLARTFLNDRSTGDLPAAAIDDWRRALELAPDEDFARQLRARLLAVEDRALGRPLLRYLVGDAAKRDPALDLLRAKEVADAAPERGLGHYLLGRMLASHDRFEEALGELDRALALGLPPGGFTVAALRVAGAAAFRVGDPARSERLWERVPRDPEADAAAVREARDFLDRCRFARAH